MHLPSSGVASRVLRRVEAYASGPGASGHVALVPSPRDVHAMFQSFLITADGDL